MKLLIVLLALAATAYAQYVNGYFPTYLDSGAKYSFAQATAFDKTRCSYYGIRVPAGTGSVTIDITGGKSQFSFLSVTAGFNFYPRADQDQTQSGYAYLFNDNNIRAEQTGRYHVCAVDPTQISGNSGDSSTTSGLVGNGCAAYAANLHLGGTLFVCLSAYSETTTGTYVGIQLTLTAKAATTVYGDQAQSLTIAPGTTTAYEITPFRFYFPSNVTAIDFGTSSLSSVTVNGAAIGSSNTKSFGSFGTNRWYYVNYISSTASTATAAYKPTASNCVAANTLAVTTSRYCGDVRVGAATQTLNFNKTTNCGSSGSTTCYATVYRFTVPAAAATGLPFYQLNISVPTTSITPAVYFSGNSFNSLDSRVNGPYQMTTGADTVNAGGRYSYVARYLVPGSEVIVGITPGSSVFDIDLYSQLLTATFTQETGINVVVGATGIGADKSTVTVSSAATASTLYYVAALLTTSGSNGYTLTTSTTTDAPSSISVVTKDFTKVIASTVGRSSSTYKTVAFNIPSNFLPQGDYYVIASPSGTGPKTYTFTVATTAASSATTAVVSIVAVVFALVAMMF